MFVSIACVCVSAFGALLEFLFVLSFASLPVSCLYGFGRDATQRQKGHAKIDKIQSLIPGNTKLGVLLT